MRYRPNRKRYLSMSAELQPRDMVLDAQAMRFVEEYIIDLDPGAAALRACLPANAGVRLLAKPSVMAAITMAKRRRATRLGIQAEEVLRRWVLAMRADINELSQLRIGACRYCWGHDHRYQFTAEELRRAQFNHAQAQLKLPEHKRREFDDHGGDGYDANRKPYSKANGQEEDCPECHGDGIQRVIYRDSRHLSEGARYLYQGVDVDKNGSIKLRIRDQGEIEKLVAQHLGILLAPKEREFTLPNAAVVSDVREMTDEELEAELSAFAEDVLTIEHEPEAEVLEEQNGNEES